MKKAIPDSLALLMCQTLEKLAVPCAPRQQFDFKAQCAEVKTAICELVVERDNTHQITADQIAQELELAYPRYCRQRLHSGLDQMIDNYRLTGQIA